MDYKKLSKTTDSLASTKVEAARIKDSLKRRKIEDSLKRRKYGKFKLTDSYKNLYKKIKDELEETETTEQAIDVVIQAVEEMPAEQVLAATVEVLASAIDVLEEQLGGDLDDLEEDVEE